MPVDHDQIKFYLDIAGKEGKKLVDAEFYANEAQDMLSNAHAKFTQYQETADSADSSTLNCFREEVADCFRKAFNAISEYRSAMAKFVMAADRRR